MIFVFQLRKSGPSREYVIAIGSSSLVCAVMKALGGATLKK